MRLAGHQDCRSCSVCGFTWCPDCDDEGQTCRCMGWGDDMEKTQNRSVDQPFYRPKPRRPRHRKPEETGASTVEYALMIAMIAALVIGTLSMMQSFRLDLELHNQELTHHTETP